MTNIDPVKYDVLLIDPPWNFKVWDKATGSGRSPDAHYPTLELADIGRLPILDLAAPNCAIFLWSVWPRIFDAERLVEMWNRPARRKKDHFTYRTLAWEWVKLTPRWEVRLDMKNLYAMLHFGMGYYLRSNPEPCLLFVRGDMPVYVHNERNVILSPVREHSQKPLEQYIKIKKLYPFARCLEMFARERYPGFDAWGNAVDSDIDLKLKPTGGSK